jgi:hypothetical protein
MRLQSMDPVLHVMLKDGVPITRAHYIHLAYFGDPPKPWTREHEAELPPELQDWKQFD